MSDDLLMDAETPAAGGSRRAARNSGGAASRRAARSGVGLGPQLPYIQRKIKVYAVLDEEGLSIIENNADIYFDFNKPVRTNTVFHTIHESLFDVVSTTTVDPEIKMDVETYPNPFSEQLRIKLSGTTQPNTTLQLYNMTGQLVRSLELNENQALLQREGLDAGLYFFTVLSGQKLLGTGKVVVK